MGAAGDREAPFRGPGRKGPVFSFHSVGEAPRPLGFPRGPAPQAGVGTWACRELTWTAWSQWARGQSAPANPGDPGPGSTGVYLVGGFLLEGHLRQKGSGAWTWLQSQAGGFRGGQPSGKRNHVSVLGTPPWEPESQDIPREAQGAPQGSEPAEVGGLPAWRRKLEGRVGTADHAETGQTMFHRPRGPRRCSAAQEAPRMEQQSPQAGPEARGKLVPCTVP